MKHFKVWIAAGALSLLSACTFHQTPLALMPVGPVPPNEFRESNDGYLIVYSPYSAWGTPGEIMEAVAHRSDYSIASGDGALARQVKNHTDAYDEGPQRIALTPGLYRIAATAGWRRKVEVPVVIKQAETTVVHLDGFRPSNKEMSQATNLVRLPNGDVVGWSVKPNFNE